jgi:hypothetical protein
MHDRVLEQVDTYATANKNATGRWFPDENHVLEFALKRKTLAA